MHALDSVRSLSSVRSCSRTSSQSPLSQTPFAVEIVSISAFGRRGLTESADGSTTVELSTNDRTVSPLEETKHPISYMHLYANRHSFQTIRAWHGVLERYAIQRRRRQLLAWWRPDTRAKARQPNAVKRTERVNVSVFKFFVLVPRSGLVRRPRLRAQTACAIRRCWRSCVATRATRPLHLVSGGAPEIVFAVASLAAQPNRVGLMPPYDVCCILSAVHNITATYETTRSFVPSDASHPDKLKRPKLTASSSEKPSSTTLFLHFRSTFNQGT